MITKVFSKNSYKKSLPFYDVLGKGEYDDDDFDRLFNKKYQFDDDLEFSSSTSQKKSVSSSINKKNVVTNHEKSEDVEINEKEKEKFDNFDDFENKENETNTVDKLNKEEINEDQEVNKEEEDIDEQKRKRKRKHKIKDEEEINEEIKNKSNLSPEERAKIKEYWKQKQDKLDALRSKMIEDYRKKQKTTTEKMTVKPNRPYLYIDDTNAPGASRKAEENQFLKGTEDYKPTTRKAQFEYGSQSRPESKFFSEEEEGNLPKMRPRRKKIVKCPPVPPHETIQMSSRFFGENADFDLDLPEREKKLPKKKKAKTKRSTDPFDSSSDEASSEKPKRKRVSKFLY